MFDRQLIFDLGLHEGYDTRFYLDKGFRVVALEANPRLCRLGRETFAADLARSDCRIVEKALWTEDVAEVEFYLRDDADGWSSVYVQAAERDGSPSVPIKVPAVTLPRLFDDYGVPYYVKCDIEGADRIFAEQLAAGRRQPPFVSVEFDSLDLLQTLRAAGYDRFQIVNQAHLDLYRCPRPAREGRHVEVAFHGKMSGLFGRELPRRSWVSCERLSAQFDLFTRLPQMNRLVGYGLRRWGKLTRRGWLIKDSWLDLHATTARMLREET